MTTEQADNTTRNGSRRARGVAYAIAAAALAAAFLFLPILLLGFTIQVVASVASGEIVAWRSSVEMTYVFLGPVALVSSLLLVIPVKLWQAAARFIGPSRATLWVGCVLSAVLAGAALFWLLQAQLHPSPAIRPEYWYALAFAAAAAVTLLAAILVARGATTSALAVIGAAAASAVILVVTLVAVWGSGPRIPAGAQTVDIIATPSGIELQPSTVHAGSVYFFADGADDPTGHGQVSFVSAGYAPSSEDTNTPLPLTEDGVDALRRGDYQGTSIESGWAGYSKLTLREGYYAFVVGAEADQPGVPPQSIAVLDVRP